MVGCNAVVRSVVALGVGILCAGCTGALELPPLSADRHVTRDLSPVVASLPTFAPPLQITEAPHLRRPHMATLDKPIDAPEPPEDILALPTLEVRGQPFRTPAAGEPAGDLQILARLAPEHYSQINAYAVRLYWRKQVNGKEQPEEQLLFKFRREPHSVYGKWLGGAGKNRELVYVESQHGNQIHILTAAGDLPLLPFAGKHVRLAPLTREARQETRDSRTALTRKAHQMVEEGVGKHLEQFAALVKQPVTLAYLGIRKQADYAGPLEAVLQKIAPGAEPGLPEGGERWWFFDLTDRFPVVIITRDSEGREVEYLRYEEFTFPQLSDDDFDPAKLWRK